MWHSTSYARAVSRAGKSDKKKQENLSGTFWHPVKSNTHTHTHIRRRTQNSPFKMLDIFRGLKNLIKVNHITTDSPVFRLHYSITVMILMSFSLIVTTRQYVGNPIDCVHTKDLPEDVLNTYCWIHSTYTLKSLFRKKVGSEVPYPGIGNSEGKLNDRKSYKYYQWVCFVLFFQVNWPNHQFVVCVCDVCVLKFNSSSLMFRLADVVDVLLPGVWSEMSTKASAIKQKYFDCVRCVRVINCFDSIFGRSISRAYVSINQKKNAKRA